MTMNLRRRGLALGMGGAMAFAAMTPALAAPVLSGTAGVKAAVPDGVTDVRWRRGGVAAGLAVGALAGAALGAAAAPSYYYGGYGYPYGGYGSYGGYGYPGYGAYAYEGPAYGYGSSYAYPYQSCGFYGGYGRWDYSNC